MYSLEGLTLLLLGCYYSNLMKVDVASCNTGIDTQNDYFNNLSKCKLDYGQKSIKNVLNEIIFIQSRVEDYSVGYG